MNRNYRRRATSRELNKVVNSFTVYKFVKALTTDFTDMHAYRAGVIDKRGNFIMNPDGKISVFDKLIINLKVLLNMIPNPSIKARLNYLTTGISLLAEDYGENPDEVKKEIEQYLEETMLLTEQDDSKKEVETTGHMTHVGDWSYTPHRGVVDPHLGLKHMRAMHDWFRGKKTEGHSVDIKADGGVSALFGRLPTGEHVAGYKSGKVYTEDQLKTHDAPWAADAHRLIQHTKRMAIEPGQMFQGDLLWAHKDQLTKEGHARPNTIPYKPTHHEIGIAVHGHLKFDEKGNLLRVGKPDHRQLQSSSVFIPRLELPHGAAKLSAARNRAISHSLKRAELALTPQATEYAKNLHKNKKFAKFFQEYSNEVVATTGKRSLAAMRKYIHKAISPAQTSRAYMDKATQKKLSDKGRAALISELETHIKENRPHLRALLRHHQHLTNAKHHMLDAMAEHHGSHDLQPAQGEEHEGLVSVMGGSMAKLTREGPRGFSARNRANSLTRFGPVKEEGAMSAGAMTASSGAVTGVTPGKPEETIVRKRRKRISALREIWNILKESAQDRGKMPKPVKVSGSSKATIFGVSKHAATPRDILQIAKKHGFEARQGSKHIHIFHGDTLIGALSKGTDAKQSDIPKLLRHMQSIVLARREAQVDRVSPAIVQKASTISPGNKEGRMKRVVRAIKKLESRSGTLSPEAIAARERVKDMLKAREKR